MNSYIYTKTSSNNFSEITEKIKEIIPQKGFKILTVHDIKSTLNSQNFEFDNYLIIELCNAKSAYKILSVSKEIGLLLPCKITVYEENKTVIVSALLPNIVKNIFDNITNFPSDLFEEVTSTLKNIVDESVS